MCCFLNLLPFYSVCFIKYLWTVPLCHTAAFHQLKLRISHFPDAEYQLASEITKQIPSNIDVFRIIVLNKAKIPNTNNYYQAYLKYLSLPPCIYPQVDHCIKCLLKTVLCKTLHTQGWKNVNKMNIQYKLKTYPQSFFRHLAATQSGDLVACSTLFSALSWLLSSSEKQNAQCECFELSRLAQATLALEFPDATLDVFHGDIWKMGFKIACIQIACYLGCLLTHV